MSNRLIALGDLHTPIHNRKAWNIALNVIDDQKPAYVVQIGDFGDWDSLSSHPRKHGVKRSYAGDKRAIRTQMRELQDAAGPHCQIVICEGNHDYRIHNYLSSRASEMEDDADFDQRHIFGLREGDIWVPYMTGWSLGKVYYTHDIGFSGKNAAAQNLAAAQHCIVTGHNHHAGMAYGGSVLGNHHFSMSLGWLGDRAQYAKKPFMPVAKMKDWQLAIGVVDYDTKWNLAFGHVAPIVNNRLILDGKEYRP